MGVHSPIIKRLATHPGQVAIVDDQRAWKGATILGGALHLASVIQRQSASSTVAVMLPTSGAFPMAALAAWWVGRVVVPLNYLLKPDELDYVVNDCDTDLVLASRKLVEVTGHEPRGANVVYLEDLKFGGLPMPRWPKSQPDEAIAALLYTSGTSGKPKGVMLTHGNLRANIEQAQRLAHLSRDDVFLGVLPQFHSFGFTVLTLAPLTIGARAVYTARFSPKRVLQLAEEHRATVVVAIPSMYGALAQSKTGGPDTFSSARFVVSGGEPLPPAVSDRFFERFGVRICEGYGLTETSPATNICLPDDYRPGSVGKAMHNLELRIVDLESDEPVGPGEEGEIRFRGPNVMIGYYKLPDETDAVFDDDGFFRTGDIGMVDKDGHLSITGRLKEMLIVGGENVFPREIEDALNGHPSVAATGVVGMRDDIRGELPLAFVELVEGAEFNETELREWCRERLAGYKVPREIRLLEALPRNPTGKIMRRELRELVDQA